MTRPRLVHVVTSPFSAWALMRGQLRFMREAGFDVTIVSAPGATLDKTAAREGVRAVAVPMQRKPTPCRDLVSLARLTKLLKRIRPDIVHVSTPKAGLLGGLATRVTGAPVRIHTLRGIRAGASVGPLARTLVAAERMTCRSAHRVYCVSESVRRQAIELGLAPPEKLVVLGSGSSNGVDSSQFNRNPELLRRSEELRKEVRLPGRAPVIGFVGRLVRDKGVVELFEAFRALRDRFPRLRLLTVGAFESYDAVPPKARSEMEGSDGVVFAGHLDDVAPAYALMDVLALPTYREGFPNVPLEAASMELPVVATRVTGCVDAVVDGVTGTLVPARDAPALAEALHRYLGDPKLRQSHGRAGRERVVREFQQERIWQALYDEYVRLLHWKGLPTPKPVREQ